ncbi:MAG: hypothetical protein JWR16_3058 [Nevskia sp.]|nr:hypothetical protein [Nevskia sp.]
MKRNIMLLFGLLLGLSIANVSLAATSSFVFSGAIEVPNSDCSSVTGNSAQWCRNAWPPNTRGAVYQYSFKETRSDTGAVLLRTAYVYKPDLIKAGASYPLLTFLHGGTQSGDQMFLTYPFAELADGRSNALAIKWHQNTAECQLGPFGSSYVGLGGTSALGFLKTDGSGNDCMPPRQTYSRSKAASPFYVVYPNGITDYSGGGRSWEDGRTPSPGQYDGPNPMQQKRDDVGFVNALIATLKQREGTLVDPTRVYVGGVSNGGVMTTRLLCNTSNGNYPELAKVAAFSVSAASMADNLYSGSNGRELCPNAGSQLTALAIFVGYASRTPNSAGQPFFANCNPYNPSTPMYPNLPACPYATISGDGVMPYGGGALDVGGGTYTVNSPTIGNVIASFDNQKFWLNYFSNSGAGANTLSSNALGYFTRVRHYRFAQSPMIYQVYETQNGLHYNSSSRYDFDAAGRIYDFLFSFRKSAGTLSYIGGTYDPASGSYANLQGNW